MNKFHVEVMTINTSKICVDESYQRKIKPAQVGKAVRTYNPNIERKPRLSYRDGKYWVFDGQHTIIMRETLNGGPLDLECEVFFGMTQYDEKELFKLQTGASSRPTESDKVRADYNAGDEYAVEMVKAIEDAGLSLVFNNSNCANRIVCVNTVTKAYHGLPYEKFCRMFKVIKTAWSGQPDSLCNQIIGGMAKFYKTYDNINDKDLAFKLSREDPIKIVREGKGMGGGNTTIARIILRIYNKNRSTGRIPDKL